MLAGPGLNPLRQGGCGILSGPLTTAQLGPRDAVLRRRRATLPDPPSNKVTSKFLAMGKSSLDPVPALEQAAFVNRFKDFVGAVWVKNLIFSEPFFDPR